MERGNLTVKPIIISLILAIVTIGVLVYNTGDKNGNLSADIKNIEQKYCKMEERMGYMEDKYYTDIIKISNDISSIKTTLTIIQKDMDNILKGK